MKKLADDFRKNSLTAKELDLFYKNCNAALAYLELVQEYSSEGWYSIRLNKGENPFPNLMKLMKS